MNSLYICTEVKRRRNALNMTQHEVASATNGIVSQPLVAQIENGKRTNPSIDTIRALARALRCNTVDLLPPEDKGLQAAA